MQSTIVPPPYHAGHGQAVAETLGERQEVGRDPVGLIAPEVLAGPPPPRLDLVADVEDVVLVEHLLQPAVEAVGRGGKPTNALDRLGDETGHVARGGDAQQVAQILFARFGVVLVREVTERAAIHVAALHIDRVERRQRGRRPRAIAGDGNSRVGLAVVAVAHRQHLVRLAVLGGHHQRRVVGLGAGVGEEDFGIGDAGQPCDLLGELDLRLDQVQGRGVKHLVGLRLDGRNHLGHFVTRHGGEDATEEVEVAVALCVPHMSTFAVDDRDRLLVVEGHPRRQHRPVPLQQLFVLTHVHPFRSRAFAASTRSRGPRTRMYHSTKSAHLPSTNRITHRFT